MQNITLIWSTGLVAIGAFGAVHQYRRLRGTDRVIVMTAAMCALVLAGLTGVCKAVGVLAEGPLYWALSTSFVLLFCALIYQDIMHEKRSKVG